MRSTSRRTFLAGGISVIGAMASTPVWGRISMTQIYDVVVIGASYSGVIAARDLESAGLKVLVLEGRQYKTLLDEHSKNEVWFHPQQKNISAEAERHNLSFVKSDSVDDALSSSLRQIVGDTYHRRQNHVVSQDILVNKFDGLGQEQMRALSDYIQALSGIYSREVRYADIKKLYEHVNGDDQALADVIGGFRLDLTGQSLYEKILSEYSHEIRYGAPVSDLDITSGKVVVSDGENRYQAKSLIMAVPYENALSLLQKGQNITGRTNVPISFANTYLSNNWDGFIDGAIESARWASRRTFSAVS